MRRCQKCGQDMPDDARYCFRDGTRLSRGDERGQAYEQPPPAADVRLGSTVGGRYRIIAQLGEGGMGTVYLARHQTLGKLVAVKYLHDELAVDTGSVERFFIEAKAAARLDHSNIVSIYDFGRDQYGSYFLVMEYAEGKGLHEIIARNAPLEQLRVLAILRQLLSAVSAAHRASIVHRDLKPENIIVTRGRGEREVIKILDFGLAKVLGDKTANTPLTLEGQFIGTPAYVSPEQIRSNPLDGRSDLYSIGTIAYELLTGAPPFEGAHLTVLRNHLFKEPTPLSENPRADGTDPRLAKLVMKLLAKKPKDRFPKADAVLARLDRIELRLNEELTVTATDEPSLSFAIQGRRPTPVVGADKSPTAQEMEADWILWESPELLLEIRRLSNLWHRRILELAEELWGKQRGRTETKVARASIRDLEERIATRETEIAIAHADLEALERKHRAEEVALRHRRLDLAERLGKLQEALGPDAYTARGRLSSVLGIVHEEPDTIEINEAELDGEKMWANLHQLNAGIEQIDRQHHRLQRDSDLARLELERKVHKKLLEVRALGAELTPLYESLATRVSNAAVGRKDLRQQLAALNEVAQAVGYCQSVLKSLE